MYAPRITWSVLALIGLLLVLFWAFPNERGVLIYYLMWVGLPLLVLALLIAVLVLIVRLIFKAFKR